MEESATGEPTVPGHLGLALRSVAAGTSAGVALVAATMWLMRTLQESGAAPLDPEPNDPIANLVLFGWVGGAIIGGCVAWVLMRPLTSTYRRGALAMVAGFAGLLLAMLTGPVDISVGRWGLLGLAAISGGLAYWLARRITSA